MDTKLNFVKLAGRWLVQLPDYPGHYSELEMVEGAEVLCDMLDPSDGEINAIVSTEPFDDLSLSSEYILDFVNSTISNGEQDGANYRCREYKLDIWLCNVTKYIFGEFPATIYIRLL